jgi:DNA-binding response OmpR family regulator
LAVYNLELLTVLIVEDNIYIRNVVENLLRTFRVGEVITAVNGEDAIEALKMSSSVARQGAGKGPDIIISDLLMSPINGMLFLRWLRGAAESPNRFVPFIMLSGAADNDYVTASRDLGTTEFLAKPFSAQSVYRRLLEVIDRPRQFIATSAYFGPDRRRRESPPTNDRRVVGENDVNIVHSSDKVRKPDRESGVWHFRLPNNLKKKLGGHGSSERGEIPTALLEQAEEKLQRSALDFTDWARNYLGNLVKLCDKAMNDPGSRSKYFEEINLLAHELRGQGGTFGYPLITVLGKMLYDATHKGCREDDTGVEIVRAHVDAMRAVIRDKVSGDGGMIGRALLKSLQLAIEKHETVG